jgi:DNA-binding response OmpR family regulator
MRVLIWADRQEFIDELTRKLKKEPYAIDCSLDQSTGLALAQSEPYKLIILENYTPFSKTLEIIRSLRQEKIPIPILVISDQYQTEEKIQVLDTGADDYITMPISNEGFCAKIRSLTRRIVNYLEEEFKIDNLTVKPNAHLVIRAGKRIQLSAKEYALLKYLISHHDQILSRQQILEHVWDFDTDPFTNTLDVYIGYLRKKVDYNFKKEKSLIHTIRGLGYCLGIQQ